MFGCSKLLGTLYKDEKGNILVLVAFMMIVLLGMSVMAVDVGSMYQTRRQTVNAADSAALAGVQEIVRAHQDGITSDAGVRDRVTAKVSEYLGYHEAELIEVTDKDGNQIVANSKTVRVVSQKEAKLFFAPAFFALLGSQSSGSDVGAIATAMLTPMNKPTHVAPFAVHESIFPVDDDEELPLFFSFSPGGEDPANPWGAGNWGTVNFEGSGANQNKIGDWIENGYDGGVSVNSTIWAAPSVGLSANLDKINYHIDEGTHLIVPVITGSTSGTGEVKVVGFAVIQLIEPYPKPGKNLVIYFKFIERDFNIDLMSGGGALDFGLESASLIE